MRKLLSALLFILMLPTIGYSVDLTTCQTITESGYYKLVNNVTVDGEAVPPCIILANDVIFDCNGYYIINNGYGGATLQVGSEEWEQINNVTIVNCRIIGNGGNTGIEISNANNVTIKNGYAIYGNSKVGYNVNNATFISFIPEYLSVYSKIDYKDVYFDNLYQNIAPPRLDVYGVDVNIENVTILHAWYEGSFISCNWGGNIYLNLVTMHSANDGHLYTSSSSCNFYIYNSNFTKSTVYPSGGEGGEGGAGYFSLIQIYSSSSNIVLNNSIISNTDYPPFTIYTSTVSITMYNTTFNLTQNLFNILSSSVNLDLDSITVKCNPVDASLYFLKGSFQSVELHNSLIEGCTYALDLTNIQYLNATHNIIVGNTYGIFVGAEKLSGQNIYIYDNLLNNTYNHLFQTYPLSNDNYVFNTTLTSGVNIVGGIYIGGNYWGSPDGSGYSDMCIDNDTDGICDEPYVLIDDPEAGVYLADYLPLTEYVEAQPPQLPEIAILNPVSEVYYTNYIPVDVVVRYNATRYDIESNISYYIDGLSYGRCVNCTEIHNVHLLSSGEHLFEVYVRYKLYENGSLVNDSILYANSTFYVQKILLQSQVSPPGGGGGAILPLVDVIIKDAKYTTYQNECVDDYLVVELKNAFDYCDVDITYEGLPDGMIEHPQEYSLKPGLTYIPIKVCGVSSPDIYYGKVMVEGLCGKDTGDVAVEVKPKFSQLIEWLFSPIGLLLIIIGLWLWSKNR